MSTQPEPYPTDENLMVLKGIDISKTVSNTSGFWTAVLKVRGDPKWGAKTQVKLYLWVKDKKGEWKRKQNFTVNQRNWSDVVKAVEALLNEKAPQTQPPSASPPPAGASSQTS